MKILYISQYFYPEVGATTNRALANIRHLARNHQVTVLTEMPNHPHGEIFPDYRGKLFLTEQMESFTVKRIWVWTSRKKVFYTRILFYLTFALFGSLYALFNARKYDLIYITSPPLFTSLTGILTKIFYPTKRIFFEVRDLWPDSAIEMGELNNKLFIKLSYLLEKSIYLKSERIITVTRYIRDEVVKKLGQYGQNSSTGESKVPADDNKVVYIPNGYDSSMPDSASTEVPAEIRDKKTEGCFIVIYAGILGLAQNLTVFIKAAGRLSSEKTHFFIAGMGPKEAELRKEAEQLKNITFLGEIPGSEIGRYLRAADCGVIPLADLPVFRGAVPSKLFEYMAYGLPVVLGIAGEAAELLAESNAGITYLPDNDQDLAEKILYLKHHKQLLAGFGENGNQYVLNHFNRQKQAEQLEKLLQ